MLSIYQGALFLRRLPFKIQDPRPGLATRRRLILLIQEGVIPISLQSLRPQSKGSVIRSVRAESKAFPYDRTIRCLIHATVQQGALLVILALAGVDRLGNNWDDVPDVQLEWFRVEITEGDGFVEVRAVNALEGQNGLGFAEVVGIGVREGALSRSRHQDGAEGKQGEGLRVHGEGDRG